MSKVALLLLLVAALCACIASAQNARPWRWCVEDEDDVSLCTSMAAILTSLDSANHSHICISGQGDSEACMKKVMNGSADLAIFDGGEILQAHQQYGMVPIRTEQNQLESNFGGYYGVGVVKSDYCGRLKKLSDLKGSKSCHTGYGRSAGWVLPVTYLLDNKAMDLVNRDPQVLNDIESVRAFFSKSCAASNDPAKRICTACKTTTNCGQDDEYYDYAGAFRCLVEGSGDVAFTKHSIPTLYAKDGQLAANWSNLQSANGYQILCPSGDSVQCSSISNYARCNFGQAPGHTIMVSGNLTAQQIDEINAVMDKANNNGTFKGLFSGDNLLADEFAAGVSATVVYNGTTENLLGPLLNRTNELNQYNAAPATKDTSQGTRQLPTAAAAAALSMLVTAAASLLM